MVALHKLTSMSKNKGGLLFGVIMGTLLGVLFAPKKGKDLRGQLKNEVEKGGLGTETLKKSFTEMGKDIADTAGEIYEQPEVQKQVKKGKRRLSDWLNENDMEDVVEKAQRVRTVFEGKIKMVKKAIGNKVKKTPSKSSSPKSSKRKKN